MAGKGILNNKGDILQRLYDSREDHSLEGAHVIADENHRSPAISDIFQPGDPETSAATFNKAEYIMRGGDPIGRIITSFPGSAARRKTQGNITAHEIDPSIQCKPVGQMPGSILRSIVFSGVQQKLSDMIYVFLHPGIETKSKIEIFCELPGKEKLGEREKLVLMLALYTGGLTLLYSGSQFISLIIFIR